MMVRCASWGRDHPRSRGVYIRPHSTQWRRPGSSPLARGLRHGRESAAWLRGIIPARAGFTHAGGTADRIGGDHPRSRGVYAFRFSQGASGPGSSPLARGLQVNCHNMPYRHRIIPARAGFTRSWSWFSSLFGDHPRSRGVYFRLRPAAMHVTGSSPLARGLRVRMRGRSLGLRDHPRSRGVYTCGSLESQRTRTLPDPCCLHCRPRARSAELR